MQGANNHISANNGKPLTEQLGDALATFDVGHPVQGESGPIFFQKSGDLGPLLGGRRRETHRH
jgi:hypothetical protein